MSVDWENLTEEKLEYYMALMGVFPHTHEDGQKYFYQEDIEKALDALRSGNTRRDQ